MADAFPPVGIDLPNPDWDFALTPEVNVEVHKLGDGYETREAVGLNWIKQNYNPRWTSLSPEVGQACYDYMLPRLKRFGVMWREPISGAVIKVVAETMTLTFDTYDNAVLEIGFRTDHNPG